MSYSPLLIHVLPDGFHRIRYFGFLGNGHCARKLERCRKLLGMASPSRQSISLLTIVIATPISLRSHYVNIHTAGRHHDSDWLHWAT
jgi:hypothetical protein